MSAAVGSSLGGTATSWLTLTQHETDSSHRVNQPVRPVRIHLLAQPGHLHVDHVIDGCRAPLLLPYVASQHLARDDVSLMAQQILEKLKLADGQVQQPPAPARSPADEI